MSGLIFTRKRRTMMSVRFLAAAGALLMMSATTVMAAESVYPRTYSADDCQLLNSQIDDSIRFSNVNSGLPVATSQTRTVLS